MIRITGNHHVATFTCGTFSQMLDASYKGTSGIDNFSCTMLEIVLHLRSYAMCTNDRDGVSVCFVRRIYG